MATPKPIPKSRQPYLDPGLDCHRLPLPSGVTALIDSADVPLVAPHLWYYSKRRGRRADCVTCSHPHTNLARLLSGATPEQVVRPKNGDALDCRRANLLILTRAELGHTTTSRQGSASSRYRGVRRSKAGRWEAGTNKVHLGTYRTEEEAARAYDVHARQVYGPHAHLNFPEDRTLSPIRVRKGEFAKPDPVPDCRKPYPDAGLACFRLPLTQGKTALIDAGDVELVSQHQWAWQEHSDPAYARYGGIAYRRESLHGPTILLTRVIMGAGPDERINLRNGDGLDCRRENMRRFDMQKSAMNVRKQRGRSSIYKGVSLIRRSGKWSANIRVDGRLMNLGTFRDEIAAAQTYDAAALEHFGEFARINFPASATAATPTA